MYFPIGWPKVLRVPQEEQRAIRQVVCNRDKILFAILTDDSLSIWFCKPCVPIVFSRRSQESVDDIGTNEIVEWRPDSSMLVVATSGGHLIFYQLGVSEDQKGLYEQQDSPHLNLRRDSAELFIKEVIPPLYLTVYQELQVAGGITSMVCIRDELMITTTRNQILRYRWNGEINRDYCLDLSRVPFCVDQQVSKAVPIMESNTYVIDIEYSPLVGGFAIVLNDGRAAFLTASSLKFDPNQVQGIWAQNIDDATCAAVNHKFRLIAFGRRNSHGIVYCIDESTGGLEASHQIVLSSKDYPGFPGKVECMKWTPDGCALAIAWSNGGLSLWSTFGTLLMCSLGWDYGLHVDLMKFNPLHIHSMEWSAEGYQLWLVKRQPDHDPGGEDGLQGSSDNVIQLNFVKSALTVNPCMSHQGHLYLQGEDRMYINLGDNLMKVYHETPLDQFSMYNGDDMFGDVTSEGNFTVTNTFMGSKQWIIVPIPYTYSGTNWPIRYTAIDAEGHNIAVAGRTGLAHFSMATRKWKLFGNETQEKDFVVTGGVLWWRENIVMGCYNIVDHGDEIRIYPRDTKLDNAFVKTVKVNSQVLLVNNLRDRLVTFCADSHISLYILSQKDNQTNGGSVDVLKLQDIDISALCVHPACVVSVTLTSLRTETNRNSVKDAESVILNVSGRLLMIQRDQKHNFTEEGGRLFQPHTCVPTVLASCVENVWVPKKCSKEKPHLTEALWLYCGAHGMRVWLPLFPRDGDKTHTFMSKRIMLPFHLRIYPLAILFEDAILLGAENDSVLFTSDSNSPFSLPFCVLEITSQVYLHQILRQLIRRNLGFHAWEIARSCTNLPYFPHSLELLLHEVLEEEATSKEPIPDALLPSVIEFIHEFPVYLQTVVQCARKTEIALWPYLFAAAGKPKDLFQECLQKKHLDTAASYLIIIQNLEPSSVSRQYATLLLDSALDHCKWELSKDLVRFLRAIDPNDVESPRASFIIPSKYGVSPQTPPVSPNEEDLSLVLGTMQKQYSEMLRIEQVWLLLEGSDRRDVTRQGSGLLALGGDVQASSVVEQVSRGRSYSTTMTPKVQSVDCSHRELSRTNSDSKGVLMRKKSVPTTGRESKEREREPGSAEEFFIDVILQRHARRLLSFCRLKDLGYFAGHLDFHLVAWLKKEKNRAARVEDFVVTIKKLHSDFMWPYPVLAHPISYYLQRKQSGSGSSGRSFPASPTIEDRMKSLTIDIMGLPTGHSGSKIGDSGYISYPGPEKVTTGSFMTSNVHPPYLISPSDFQPGQTVEAHLMPHVMQDDSSLLSEESSYWGDEKDHYTTDDNENTWSDGPLSQDFEQLSQELANRGPAKAEVQLRYLLQLFMEASCLEWSLIVSVLLRDAMAVLRTTNAARSPDQSSEIVLHLKEGLVALNHWSNTECLGYKPFMIAIMSQVQVLNNILISKSSTPPSIPSSRQASRTTSINLDEDSAPSHKLGSIAGDHMEVTECSSATSKERSEVFTNEERASKESSRDKEPVPIEEETVTETAEVADNPGCVIS